MGHRKGKKERETEMRAMREGERRKQKGEEERGKREKEWVVPQRSKKGSQTHSHTEFQDQLSQQHSISPAALGESCKILLKMKGKKHRPSHVTEAMHLGTSEGYKIHQCSFGSKVLQLPPPTNELSAGGFQGKQSKSLGCSFPLGTMLLGILTLLFCPQKNSFKDSFTFQSILFFWVINYN